MVTPQQILGIEVELLQCAVAGVLRREARLQALEHFAALLDRINLLNREAGQREQKRAGEVGPEGVAVEVGPLQRVPWRR
jgi:hypothetical protein